MPGDNKKTKEEKRLEREEKQRKQEIIIAKYEQNPVLYDKANSEFKDVKRKNAILQEIADLVGWSVRDVCNTWRNLRDRYKKEKRIMNTGASGDAAPNPSVAPKVQWRFFDNFKFLETHLRKRDSLCTTQESQDNENEDENEESDDESSNEKETEENTGEHVIPDTDDAFDMSKTPDRLALQQLQDFEEQIFGKEAAAANLFGEPSQKKPRKDEGQSDEIATPEAKKPLNKEAKSNSLTPKVPILSPHAKKGVHAARSKAKREAELNTDIRKALSQLDNIGKPAESKDPCQVLGESIGTALAAMGDEVKQRAWKRKLRGYLCDIEEGLGPNE